MRDILVVTVASAAVALVTAVAYAQHHQSKQHHPKQPHKAPSSAAVASLFGFTVHGGFRRMIHMQDYEPKVRLKSIVHAGATEAVGAASGLRGEITMIGGKLLLTYGAPCPTCGHPGEEHATLLASSRVAEWRAPVVLPSDLSGASLDAWVVEQAKAAGLDVAKPFPVRLTGTLIGVKMHVIRAPNPSFKGHGSGSGQGHSMAFQEDIAVEKIDGNVVGFYAPTDLQGVITHPGEPFHYHWVDTGRTRTAHLDTFGMAKGAQLLLPSK